MRHSHPLAVCRWVAMPYRTRRKGTIMAIRYLRCVACTENAASTYRLATGELVGLCADCWRYPELPEFRHYVDDGATVLVTKNGGGTPGKHYAGEYWTYWHIGADGTVTYGNDLYMGSPAHHRTAAVAVHEFLTTES